MGVRVKICGVRTLPVLRAAVDAGADYVGLVFYPRSPRNVTLEGARALAEEVRGGAGRSRARSVGLLVDPDDALVDAVVREAAPDMLQLHGDETPERVAALRARTGRAVIKAVKVASANDVRGASRYSGAADLVLFDARPPQTPGALPGGNGAVFDWSVLAEAGPGAGLGADFMLSGGLTPDNVRQAIAVTGAPIVDASSGVELAPGEKDEALIRRFIQAAKSQQ